MRGVFSPSGTRKLYGMVTSTVPPEASTGLGQVHAHPCVRDVWLDGLAARGDGAEAVAVLRVERGAVGAAAGAGAARVRHKQVLLQVEPEEVQRLRAVIGVGQHDGARGDVRRRVEADGDVVLVLLLPVLGPRAAAGAAVLVGGREVEGLEEVVDARGIEHGVLGEGLGHRLLVGAPGLDAERVVAERHRGRHLVAGDGAGDGERWAAAANLEGARVGELGARGGERGASEIGL